jgi:hypothetical protein
VAAAEFPFLVKAQLVQAALLAHKTLEVVGEALLALPALLLGDRIMVPLAGHTVAEVAEAAAGLT